MTEKRGIWPSALDNADVDARLLGVSSAGFPQGWANSGATRSNWLAIHSLAALRSPATSLLVLSFAAGAQLRGL